jgi:acyl carrier protein
MSAVTVEAALRGILESAVGKRALPATLSDGTELLGSIPELDSMAVLGVLTQIQDDFGVQIDDDEVSADIFQTFGDLKRFVEAKLA